MKRILQKLKLIQSVELNFYQSRADFSSYLSTKIDKSGTGMFSESFDAFESSKNEYKGRIDHQGFKIKRRRQFFDFRLHLPIATGVFIDNSQGVTLQIDIRGLNGFMIPLTIFLFIMMTAITVLFITLDNASPALLSGLAAPALFSCVIFIVMRTSTSRMKRELINFLEDSGKSLGDDFMV